jgi:DNA-binding NarL/FixJ family response regulator
MIKVTIVDDHVIFAEGLESIFLDAADIQITARCHNAESFWNVMKTNNIDVVLLDISLPDVSGLNVCEQIVRDYPNTKVIALTMHDEPSLVKKMIKKGAMAYLLKNTTKSELWAAIRTVYSGKKYYNENLMQLLLDGEDKPKKNSSMCGRPHLTRREKEVLDLIAKGLTTQQIADKLFVSIKAVEFHRSSLLTKFGSQNTPSMIKEAIEYEFIS